MFRSHPSVQVNLTLLRLGLTNSCHRFERTQYMEVREAWTAATGELAGKSAVTTYGAEHLCRLLGTPI